MDSIVGKWKEIAETAQNVDAFMNAIGLPDDKKEVCKSRKYEMTCTKDGNVFKVHVQVIGNPNLTEDYSFELDKEFTFKDIDGQDVTGKVNWDGSKFQETYNALGSSFVVVREFVGPRMKTQMTVKDVSTSVEWEKC